MSRVCAEPGCPAIVKAGARDGRCDRCRRARDRERGTRQRRGYDADFERQKRRPEYVNATHCAECGELFTTDNPKTGGHSVAIRNGGKGSTVLAHCRRCNYGWERTGL